MVYMSRMPVGGKEGQSRLSKRSGDGPKRSTGTDGSNDTDHGLDSERESHATINLVCAIFSSRSGLATGMITQRVALLSGGPISNDSYRATPLCFEWWYFVPTALYRHASTLVNSVSLALFSLRLPGHIHHPGVTGDSVSSGEGDPQPTNEQIPSQRELEAKIQCASTLLAWSTHRDNAQRLAKVWKLTFTCSSSNIHDRV